LIDAGNFVKIALAVTTVLLLRIVGFAPESVAKLFWHPKWETLFQIKF
jgi:hypothetical protein